MSQPTGKPEAFQVDLKGMVEVLSQHLYSSPTVFVRELLQNAVDAIEARKEQTPKHKGIIRFEVDGETGTIIVSDNGIGLTHAQIRDFVSQVGASSKRVAAGEDDARFIGQFGIGLLSGFIVADELLILTKSVDPDSPTLQWKATADGSYEVTRAKSELKVGTRVILRVRPDAAEYASLNRLLGLVRRYGQYLTHQVIVEATGKKRKRRIAGETPPWVWGGTSHEDDFDRPYDEELVSEIGFEPLAEIPIRDEQLGLEAVAFVLPETTARGRTKHRLYLKHMFVGESAVQLLPSWAAFAQFVVHSTKLSPTASRESVREDDTFAATQKALIDGTIGYLHQLAKDEPLKLAHILAVHDDLLREVAMEDDEFFKLAIDLFSFETSVGPVRFAEFRAEHTVIRVATTVDQFRATSALAAAQGITVFNGGYARHTELLERAAALLPGLTIEQVDTRTLLEGLETIPPDDAVDFAPLLEVAAETLQAFECGVLLRRFEPPDIAAVMAEGSDRSLARSLQSSFDVSEGFWSEILAVLSAQVSGDDAGAFLCLNAASPTLTAVLQLPPEQMGAVVRVLYVQALLLGRQPLTFMETQQFQDSLQQLIQAAARGANS